MLKNNLLSLCLTFAFVFVANSLWANNIQVSNVSTTVVGTDRFINFSVSWDNSWRTNTNSANWDAAWIFVKFRRNTNTAWSHATLNYAATGTATACGHTEPSGASITTPADGKGAFIYRNADGGGSVSFANAAIKWNYAADGLNANDPVTVEVYAVEMVYVPQGSFYLGSGGSNTGEFRDGNTNNPLLVTSEGAITVGTAAGNLNYTGSTDVGDAAGPIPAAFPKGFGAFYCMKYEISQGQYADFLNNVLSTQATNRYLLGSYPNYRYYLSGTHPNYNSTVVTRACNYLNWSDGLAYADWSGLRPMTETEYEKACRGSGNNAVFNEFAWGNTNISYPVYQSSSLTYFTNNHNNNETGYGGNCIANMTNSANHGPSRSGCYATGVSTRESAGATYYGIMEMSGNLWEQVVPVGSAAGRSFTGAHGDGALDANGAANVSGWSLASSGLRGGSWFSTSVIELRTSGRPYSINTTPNTRGTTYGFRGVRTAQ
jgi:formylglycine-generating enzyme required for sulfatase activity